jgi:hypothetical protein
MAQADCVSNGIRAPNTGASAKLHSTAVQAAHAKFVTALAGHPPSPIPLFARAADLEDRADHLKTLLNALSVYVTAVLNDTAQNVPGGLDRRFVAALLSDLTSEAIGIVQNAADEQTAAGGVPGRAA